jgi:glycosyltransferase involved in cell wall biosynthesis
MMARWIIAYARDETLRRRQGAAGRKHIEDKFSMQAMVASYLGLYDRLLGGGAQHR